MMVATVKSNRPTLLICRFALAAVSVATLVWFRWLSWEGALMAAITVAAVGSGKLGPFTGMLLGAISAPLLYIDLIHRESRLLQEAGANPLEYEIEPMAWALSALFLLIAGAVAGFLFGGANWVRRG
jgi:hypothetical protein